jgi:MscS family membrane protein
MGDLVKIRGYFGVVEEIGFRSTRIRTLDGHLVTIPNGVLATDDIENVAKRPSIKRVMNVTVTYDTPPEKVQRGVEILREMLDARSEHFPQDFPPKVYFSDFNADSLNILVYYWFTPADWWEYLDFNHDFNTELLRRYNEEGIEFAFPTQTLYLKSDGELDTNVTINQGPRPREM